MTREFEQSRTPHQQSSNLPTQCVPTDMTRILCTEAASCTSTVQTYPCLFLHIFIMPVARDVEHVDVVFLFLTHAALTISRDPLTQFPKVVRKWVTRGTFPSRKNKRSPGSRKKAERALSKM